MPKITVYNLSREAVGELELDATVFAAEIKSHLLHAVVRKQLAARRAGTHAVKRRADVSGGGRKPFKQKGTGRARQGTSRAPQMRGGGVVFGPIPRSYDFKVNKKEMAAALRSALSTRAGAGELIVVDGLSLQAPKTKEALAFLERFELTDVLLVTDDANDNVRLAARNLPKVTLLQADGVNVYDVLLRSRLVMTAGAVEAVSRRLGGE
jgi:large subunit ribosomal protein L4